MFLMIERCVDDNGQLECNLCRSVQESFETPSESNETYQSLIKHDVYVLFEFCTNIKKWKEEEATEVFITKVKYYD
ncbi:hypothetical protein G5I_12600 [Acromyrmex echinatior]|uniref:Uncharacterized protein n=1 Tax=Acromyrmex echinatior TaxID=103372 RepID=F4X2R9_ACREC|nr:hypothetical protein G5I_12600 [Acromyrmex echinatior]